MDEKVYWVAFSACSGIGPTRFQQLRDHFGSAKAAWSAEQASVEKVIGVAFAQKLEIFKKSFSPEKYFSLLKQKRVKIVTLLDESFPTKLKELKNCPFILYVRGDEQILSNDAIAVVGTRKITQYGRDVTEMITRDLVSAGFTIVSGLAFGVDAIAHDVTIENGGKTIAVLGCGVDCCTPSSNQRLYNSIIEKGGAVISENPLGEPPNRGSFPARNRIVAALSLGVVVTEGAEDSGALITAEDGLNLGRKVFAVPGPITSSLSKGPYKLIAKGAKLVTRGEDIVKELGIMNYELRKGKKKVIADTKEEEIILELLENEALQFDEIVKKLKLPSSEIGAILSLMEIKGLIVNKNDNYSPITNR